MKTKIAILLAALVALAPLAALVRAENDRSAEVLVENAKRLQQLVHYRNEVIASSNLSLSINASVWNTILNLTLEADHYLGLAIEQLSAGNATLAKRYALTAMNLYSDVLELQSEIAEELGLEFRFAGALPMNLTSTVSNMTVALNKTALVLQLQVLEARISQLREQLSRVNASLYDISDALALLERASSVLAEARAALSSGSITVSELARMLGEVKGILGLVNAELNRAALHVAIARAMKLGWLKSNETGYLNATLNVKVRNETLRKLIRERVMNWTKIEEFENSTKRLVKRIFEEVKNRIEKTVRESGAAAKVAIKVEKRVERAVEAGKEAPPATPPGWVKKAERESQPTGAAKQNKGARG